MSWTPEEIRDLIWEEVLHERTRQIGKGYSLEHDDKHRPQEMVMFANWRFTSPATMEGRPNWYSRQTFIQAIAVLVAAVEVMDRRKQRQASDDQASSSPHP